MAALIIPFPPRPQRPPPRLHLRDLRGPRAVVARPDWHDDATVLDACETLECFGDWIDVQRARALRDATIRRAALMHSRRAAMRRWIRVVALLTGAFALGFVLALWP